MTRITSNPRQLEPALLKRRQLLKTLALLGAALAGSPGRGWAALGDNPLSTEALKAQLDQLGNFAAIYGQAELKARFASFLKEVFHLYPQQSFHQLIASEVKPGRSDQDCYLAIQTQLDTIAPWLKDLRYSLPALNKQKQLLAAQTCELLGERKQFDSYLELGSGGRYLDSLEESLAIGEERYFIAEREPGYSPVDMIDRGQIAKAGSYFSLNQYQLQVGQQIAPGSLDMINVYIGFHHCPIPLRGEFFAQLRSWLKPDGVMVVRDHNVDSTDMFHLVALAHDVFNMGTQEAWAYNAAELRNFYSLDYLQQILADAGFKTDGRRLYQRGDPTHNALMLFSKA